jgi:hypothetical protein
MSAFDPKQTKELPPKSRSAASQLICFGASPNRKLLGVILEVAGHRAGELKAKGEQP